MIDGLREYLTRMQKMESEGGGFCGTPDGWSYRGIADFVFREGRPFTPAPLPEGIRRGAMKECYKNAFDLMQRRRDLIYVEGYAQSVIPVLHAWCVDHDGNVVDPTWEHGASAAYFGVPFDRDFVIKTVLEKDTYGLIDDRASGYKLLRGCENWRSQDLGRDTMDPAPGLGG